MLKKGFRQLLTEAAAAIETVTVEDALKLQGDPDVIFVDVRDQTERAAGTIPGSVHAPRGFLEFVADPESPMHDPALASGKRLILFCASGGRSSLAAKTIQDMGLPRVSHMAGGFTAWVRSGGPSE